MAAVVSSCFVLLLMIGTATMTVVHSREKLLELRPTIKSSRVAKEVYFMLKELNIYSVKPTKRDSRPTSKQNEVINKQNVHHVVNSRAALWNARSMINKTADICDLVISENLDLLTITEAWLECDVRDNPAIADINNTLPDFNVISLAHVGKKGGGLCVVYL